MRVLYFGLAVLKRFYDIGSCWPEQKNAYQGATIAQWIHVRLPSCRPGFESQAAGGRMVRQRRRTSLQPQVRLRPHGRWGHCGPCSQMAWYWETGKTTPSALKRPIFWSIFKNGLFAASFSFRLFYKQLAVSNSEWTLKIFPNPTYSVNLGVCQYKWAELTRQFIEICRHSVSLT